MNSDKVFTKHDDAAHGWLEVSFEDLIDVNIQNKISNFSYIDSNKNLIYLEEDVDMVLFMKRNIKIKKILKKITLKVNIFMIKTVMRMDII